MHDTQAPTQAYTKSLFVVSLPRNNSPHTINTIILCRFFSFSLLPHFFSFELFFIIQLSFHIHVSFFFIISLLFESSFFFTIFLWNKPIIHTHTHTQFIQNALATVVNSVCLSTDLVSYSASLHARASKLFSLRGNAGERARARGHGKKIK